MNRRQFLLSSAALALSAAAFDPIARAAAPTSALAPTSGRAKVPDDVVWHDVRDIGFEGRAFDDTESYFDRLPARAKGAVRPEVWNLGHHTAGMSVRFETDSTDIFTRYTLIKSELAMAHMPASGVSGLDLYAQQDGTWRWAGSNRPAVSEPVDHLGQRLAPGMRLYQINLPLYNGVKSMEIGVPKSAAFTPIPPRKEKAILFYGTSITQGGCASRPGMAFTHILGRRLNKPMLNFGFSGNGRMEVEVAQFLTELDSAIFVLDCVANMAADTATERTEAVVKLLREKHPDMPILILDERPWANAPLVPQQLEGHQRKSAAMRKAYDNLTAAGVKNLHFGDDGEATVDGSHPTDLGMMRYADYLEPQLRKLL